MTIFVENLMDIAADALLCSRVKQRAKYVNDLFTRVYNLIAGDLHFDSFPFLRTVFVSQKLMALRGASRVWVHLIIKLGKLRQVNHSFVSCFFYLFRRNDVVFFAFSSVRI